MRHIGLVIETVIILPLVLILSIVKIWVVDKQAMAAFSEAELLDAERSFDHR
jgi:hypothetical protein